MHGVSADCVSSWGSRQSSVTLRLRGWNLRIVGVWEPRCCGSCDDTASALRSASIWWPWRSPEVTRLHTNEAWTVPGWKQSSSKRPRWSVIGQRCWIACLSGAQTLNETRFCFVALVFKVLERKLQGYAAKIVGSYRMHWFCNEVSMENVYVFRNTVLGRFARLLLNVNHSFVYQVLKMRRKHQLFFVLRVLNIIFNVWQTQAFFVMRNPSCPTPCSSLVSNHDVWRRPSVLKQVLRVHWRSWASFSEPAAWFVHIGLTVAFHEIFTRM